MSVKEPKSFEEQLDILKKRGVSLDDRDEYAKAYDIIKRVGYYRLINGYKKLFIEIPANEATGTEEKYKSGTTVSEIYSLYYFDWALRTVMLSHILPIEAHIKSLISYVISEEYGKDNYLIYQNFNTQKSNATKLINGVISDIHKQIAKRYGDPSIHHYLSKYGFIPMWVLNNILTMGITSRLFSIMKVSDRQKVSREFNVLDNALENYLLLLTDVRNIAAHGNRLFCMRTKKPLQDTPIHAALNIQRGPGEYLYGKRDLFAALIAMKYLVSGNDFEKLVDEISELINDLRPHLHTIEMKDVLQAMGFPKKWKQIKRRDIK